VTFFQRRRNVPSIVRVAGVSFAEIV